MTAITVIASKYGVQQLIGALTGNATFGELAAELVGELAASESRIGERLAAIEHQLAEVLDQRYVVAVGAGVRTLIDAGTTPDAGVRHDELLRARELFREAVAAARWSLQRAVAERYLLLCAVGLGRWDAAHTALDRFTGAATEALFDCARPAESWWPFGRKRIQAQAAAIDEASALTERLVREAGVFSQGFGRGEADEFERKYGGPGLWVPAPRSALIRVGALSIAWNEVTIHDLPEDPSPTEGARRVFGATVRLTVRARPTLSRQVGLVFSGLDPAYHSQYDPDVRAELAPGQCELTLTGTVPAHLVNPPSEPMSVSCRLLLGGVLDIPEPRLTARR